MPRALFLQFLAQVAGDGAGNGEVPEAGSGGGMGPFGQFLPFILIGFIIWFLLIRPESRKRKQLQLKVSALKKGDEIITNGGIFGKVMKVSDKDLVVQIDKDKDVRIHLSKGMVLDVIREPSGADAPAESKS
ncbi:MAG: preprotein translocase subunit YajC [Planctomycetota bacterium]|nr:preprotein translocase subunit YajC [Planctomycetota bacterium]